MSDLKKLNRELTRQLNYEKFRMDTIFQYVEDIEMMTDELSKRSEYNRGYHDAFLSMYNLISAMLCDRNA